MRVQCILALCDIQIVTGLSIMTAGYIMMGLDAKMSAYHWQIIIYLAWFSNLTHQATLVFLRGYLRDHPQDRLWRFGLTTALVVMLVVALVPAVFFNWDTPDQECSAAFRGTPARCFYSGPISANLLRQQRLEGQETCLQTELRDSTAFQFSLILIAILLFSYTWRTIKLFESLSWFVHNRLREILARFARMAVARVLQCQLPCRILGGPLWSLLVLRPVLALYILGRLILDFYGSAFADVSGHRVLIFIDSVILPRGAPFLISMQIFLLMLSATVGTLRLFAALGNDPTTSEWSFGQVMAVILLIGPILMFARAILGIHRQISSSASPTHCARFSAHTATGESAGNRSEIRETESLFYVEEHAHSSRQHLYTTKHPAISEEINQLFKRDYYNEFVWIVFAICTLIVITLVVFSILTISLVQNFSIPTSAFSFLLPILEFPSLCHNMITLGLATEGWKYEFHVMLAALLLTIGFANIPVVGMIMSVLGLQGNHVITGGWAYEPWLTAMTAFVTCGPMVTYVIVCPLLVWIAGRKSRGSKSGHI